MNVPLIAVKSPCSTELPAWGRTTRCWRHGPAADLISSFCEWLPTYPQDHQRHVVSFCLHGT